MQQLAQARDYQLPAPTKALPTGSPATAQAPAVPLDNGVFMSDIEFVIGIVLVLVVAALAYFVKRSLTSHLIDAYASPEAAVRTGWMFFFFIVVLAATVIFGFLGNLWLVLSFIIPMGGLALASLIISLILYVGAQPRR